MKKSLVIIIVALILIGLISLLVHSETFQNSFKKNNVKLRSNTNSYIKTINNGYKNINYTIDGDNITLVDGKAETSIPDSSMKIVTEYFDLEKFTDLNGDGRDDVVFVLSQETGGTGVFYYLVAALNTDNGWIGSRAYFIGDRVIPKSLVVSDNIISLNYLDRNNDQSFAEEPSINKNILVSFNVNNLQFERLNK